MSLSAKELELITERLLEEGVPPGVVARVFDLDVDLVREAQKAVRVLRYGTDDLEEYTEQTRWDAMEHARRTIATGSEADKTRFSAAMLGKTMAASARRTPAGVIQNQETILEMMEKMRTGEPAEPREQSRFVARLSNRPEDDDAES